MTYRTGYQVPGMPPFSCATLSAWKEWYKANQFFNHLKQFPLEVRWETGTSGGESLFVNNKTTMQMNITSKPIGQAGMAYVLADVKRRFEAAAGNGSATKDSQLNYGTIVKLPKGWKEKFWPESYGQRPEWLDTITHGRIKGRVVTTDLSDLGRYWVSLIQANGGWTNHTIFVDEWELSVAQQGEGK